MTNDEVLIALGWDRTRHHLRWCWRDPEEIAAGIDARKSKWLNRRIPRPMSSVDDGLSLVPEGWNVELRKGEGYSPWRKYAEAKLTEFSDGDGHFSKSGNGKTLSAALSAALIKVKCHDQ